MKPEITWTICPVCDVKRPFMARQFDEFVFPVSVTFTCLGCGESFDDEGLMLEPLAEPVASSYRAYREEHDQVRRYPAARGVGNSDII